MSVRRHEFWCTGIPQTQGSTRAFVVKGRAVTTHDKKPALMDWRRLMADAARKEIATLFETPVDIVATFVLPRPKSAPRRVLYPAKKPDIDKLARAVLDALTGVVYVDDATVVGLIARKVFCAVGQQPGVRVIVQEAFGATVFDQAVPSWAVTAEQIEEWRASVIKRGETPWEEAEEAREHSGAQRYRGRRVATRA